MLVPGWNVVKNETPPTFDLIFMNEICIYTLFYFVSMVSGSC